MKCFFLSPFRALLASMLVGGLLAPTRAQDDSTVIEPPTTPIVKLNPKPFDLRERLAVGGWLGLGFFRGLSLEVSPVVGYRLTKGLLVGPGVSYLLFSYQNTALSSYGARVFARQRLVDIFHVQVEYEWFNVADRASPSIARRWIGAPIVGLTIEQPTGPHSAYFTSILWNFNYDVRFTPYINPILRFGYFF